MRAVIQRVKVASVEVKERTVGTIESGLLVFLGVGKDDTRKDCEYLADKVVNLRIFADAEGRMNRSLLETGG
ncbi:MAG: D-aminoacyl-tRNA deacylase, partial [Deltaproteobacteria bacterium]